MAGLRADLRFGARLLLKSPGFSAVAILTLALAIGANTAIFSVVNGVLLQPLPLPEAHRLFWVVRRDVASGRPGPVSVPQYAFFRGQEQPFSALTAYPVINSGFNLSGDGLPERVSGARVTQPFFEVFGLPPALGRAFVPEEDVPGGARVVVLGHGLWQRRFGGRPDVLGRSVTLNGESYTVIGVAPPGFQHPEGAQLWVPLQAGLATSDNTHYLAVVGLLRPGVEAGQVGALVKAQGEQLRAARPELVPPEIVLDADSLQAISTRMFKLPLLVIWGGVGLVLLIACVNLANLQLARAGSRERELAVRIALGAGPGRILRQFLTESVLLSGAGGVLGLLLAAWLVPALVAVAPGGSRVLEGVGLDGTVLAFTLGVSVLTGVLFGLLPAWQASRRDPRSSLQVSALQSTPAAAGSRTRRLLVISEVALALILLIGASLLVKSFALLRGVAPGLDPDEVLTMKLSLPEARYGTPEALEVFAQRVTERVRGLPGVQAAGFALTLPFEVGAKADFVALDRSLPDGEKKGEAHYRPVTKGYFEALKIQLVRGRLMDELDRHVSAPVAVINEAMARRYWPGQDALGQRISLGGSLGPLKDKAPREIIGIVRDVRELGLYTEPPPIVYVPLGQVPEAFHAKLVSLLPQCLLVRASEDGGSLGAAVQREIQVVDSLQPVTESLPMEEIISRSVGVQRFSALLLGGMAVLALVLAAVGVYGVLSYLVSQRTRELGVRLALGATRGAVVWFVLRQGLSTVAAGVALGMVGAFWLTRLLERLLYGVSALDPAMFVMAPVALVGVALVAMWFHARRAARVDPMVSLRSE
jgi:predicted permease